MSPVSLFLSLLVRRGACAGLLAVVGVAAADGELLNVPRDGRPGFTLLPSEQTGVRFTNHLPAARWLTNTMLLNGSGVAAGDVDGDGRPDLVFGNLAGRTTLYRNLGGWRFEDLTSRWGAALPDWPGSAVALADLDGDGDLDLVGNSMEAGTRVFLNDGRGGFTPHGVPLNVGKAGTSLALADVDGDGDLDLYVANYRADSIRDHPDKPLQVEMRNGRPVVAAYGGVPVTTPELAGRFQLTAAGQVDEQGEPDQLFLNDGRAGFSPVPWDSGAFLDAVGSPLKGPPLDWGLSCLLRDLDGDGRPDLYVCNDFGSPDRLWWNRTPPGGPVRFQMADRMALRHSSTFSMGIDAADFDRDGHDDFYVVDMLSPRRARRENQIGNMRGLYLDVGAADDRPQYSHNTLLRSRGDGTFAEMALYAGVPASEWSWGVAFLDVDLDGWEDLLVTTGHELDAMDADVTAETERRRRSLRTAAEIQGLRRLFPRLALPNVAFRNNRDWTFSDTSAAWGFDTVTVSHGLCLADLDGDGDLDVAVNNLNGPAGLYRNNSTAPRLAVALRGERGNTRGIGARIRVLGGPVDQSQVVVAGGRYLSSDEPVRTFATGPATRLSIEVTWPSGRRSVLADARPNHRYVVPEAGPGSGPGPGPGPEPARREPLFADVSDRLGHVHQDEPFDDLARQPLLPRLLSQAGPGVTWNDVDGDGWEDLLIAAGGGGRLGAYRNDGRGGFAPMGGPLFERALARDQTTVLGLGSNLLVGQANYEDGTTNGGWIAVYNVARGVSGQALLGPEASTGPLALGDVDGDGTADLFVGARVVAGRYPAPAVSRVFRNSGGRFSPWQTLSLTGLVSGACFADLTGDGRPELVVASEWGPLQIFRPEQGKLVPWPVAVELGGRRLDPAELSGWWNGVIAGDFDGDGRLDLVASNWGLNHWDPGFSLARRPSLRRIHFGDLGTGTGFDLLETFVEGGGGAEFPARSAMALRGPFPVILEKTATREAYGRATVAELFDGGLPGGQVEARWFAHTVFLNRGDHFEARFLPPEAQWSPAFGVSVADFDGDGREDLFLAQNFFANEPEAWRLDAGRGLVLRGDGRGGFEPMPGRDSGLVIWGEQRGCAVADFDADGRPDLAVGQNRGPTRLFRNQTGRPGLRVRLPWPAAIGAVVRAVSGDTAGPVRAVQAGAGYWSQDGAVVVLAAPAPPTAVEIRWPGGRVTRQPVAPGERELKIPAP